MREVFFAYLGAVLSYSLSGWCPGLEQHHSSDECQCHQQTTSRTNEKEGLTAKQPVHWESRGRTGPPDYFSLSLPLHVSLLLFHFLSLDTVWATKLRQERGVGSK